MTQYKKICILCSAAVIASSICGANLKGQQAGAATNVSSQYDEQQLKNKLAKLKITYIYVGDEVPQNVQNYFDINRLLPHKHHDDKSINSQHETKATINRKKDKHKNDRKDSKNTNKKAQIINSKQNNTFQSKSYQQKYYSTSYNQSSLNNNKLNHALISHKSFMIKGVINWNQHYFTYASERVAPGGALHIPGRHHEDGYVVDKDGYIVLGAKPELRGQIFNTPFGKKGKVYDAGPTHTNHLNVYVE